MFRYVSQPLGPFHVLVGPNASGKTTFLDTIAFLGRLVSDGVEAAIEERTRNFEDLVWNRSGASFELAIEAKVPEDRRAGPTNKTYDVIRYEIELGLDQKTGVAGLRAEKALLKPAPAPFRQQPTLFPEEKKIPGTMLSAKSARGVRTIVNKVPGGNDNFYDETGKGWDHAFKLGPRKSALGNLPEDESRFPVCTWLKRLLVEGVQQLILNSLLIRKASPPGQGRQFKSDGSNLPWVVASLEQERSSRLSEWVEHLRTALPEIEGIRTIERADDRHRYLVICHRGGLELPSWMTSDGTLRLLALTLPAYLPGFSGVYLIEEPENGIHPRAVETMFQSLSSVYGAQILIATHSPVILSVVDPRTVLCFAKTPSGATDIVAGNDHPALREWRGETNLGVLLAAGVLG